VEGAHFLAGNALVSLSVQQLLECDHQGTDNGCGGSVSNLDAYEYVIKNGGLTSFASYPFVSANDTIGHCDATKAAKAVATISHQWQISGFGHLKDSYPNITETFPGNSPWNLTVPVNESRVIEALVRTGPLSITINAGGESRGGVCCGAVLWGVRRVGETGGRGGGGRGGEEEWTIDTNSSTRVR
jgi:hypothetical protein